RTKELSDVAEQLKNTGTAWRAALGDLNDANLTRFTASHPDWAPRLKPEALPPPDAPPRRATTGELLADLKPSARVDRASARGPARRGSQEGGARRRGHHRAHRLPRFARQGCGPRGRRHHPRAAGTPVHRAATDPRVDDALRGRPPAGARRPSRRRDPPGDA